MDTSAQSATNEVSGAYEALLRRKAVLQEQRDDLDRQLSQIDNALNALQDVVASIGTGDTRRPAEKNDAPPANAKVDKPSKPTSRRARIRALMLERSNEWLKAGEIAYLIEGTEPTEAQKNAAYELLRRMAKQGELERDDTTRPTRYRGKSKVLRQHLVEEGTWA
jgi:hypothetical protein